MKQIHEAGIQAVVVPFWATKLEVDALHPHNAMYKNGQRHIDQRIFKLLHHALKNKVQVLFQLMDHRSRTIQHIQSRSKYLRDRYARHEAVYKDQDGKIVIFIERSDKIFIHDWQDWRSDEDAARSIRYVGTWKSDGGLHATQSRLDGVYVENHGSASSFSAASNGISWSREITSRFSVLKISPGKNEIKIRPWTKKEVINRGENGSTYEKSWRNAMLLKPDSVLIVSFNDWCRSTQVRNIHLFCL
jgi:hypothetical protein